MKDEEAIYRDFCFNGLSFSGAVQRLVAIGYLQEDAEEVVDEWADALEWAAEKDRC